MTNPAVQPAVPRPLGFGIGFARGTPQAAAAAAPAPAAANASTDAAQHQEPSATAGQADEQMHTPTPVGAVASAATGPITPVVGDTAAAPAAAAEPERIAVMLGNGGREGLIFGGVFGHLEEGKFRTDAALKSIYLLQLVDGAEPGAGVDQVQRDLMAAMGGLPETTVVAVPGELAASFKATLAALSGQRWDQMYASAAGASNPMVKFALSNEQRIAQDAVARIVAAGGEAFTVQVSTPKRLRYTDVANIPQDDELDEYLPASGLHFVMESPAAPVTTSVSPGPLRDAPSYEQFLNVSSTGRTEGDVVSFNLVESFSVIAADAPAAERVHHLVPPSLRAQSTWTVSDMQINGVAFSMPPPADDEDAVTDAPR